MKTAGSSHVGKLRKNNQDGFFARCYENYSVLLVADGMGGHNGGEIASSMVIDTLEGYFDSRTDEDVFSGTTQIIDFIKGLNTIIYQKSLIDADLSGMGTTLTLAVANESVAIIFHVGDSRAYQIHSDGRIHQITKDHSLVQYMIDTKQITPKQALTHPNRNIITRAVGTDLPLDVDMYIVSMNKNDKLLLCSDGLTNMLGDYEISEIVVNYDIETAVGKLIHRANEQGGVDNITAVLFEG